MSVGRTFQAGGTKGLSWEYSGSLHERIRSCMSGPSSKWGEWKVMDPERYGVGIEGWRGRCGQITRGLAGQHEDVGIHAKPDNNLKQSSLMEFGIWSISVTPS